MEIYYYKRKIKDVAKNFIPTKPETTNVNNEIVMRGLNFVESVIDDDSRKNTYCCEM